MRQPSLCLVEHGQAELSIPSWPGGRLAPFDPVTRMCYWGGGDSGNVRLVGTGMKTAGWQTSLRGARSQMWAKQDPARDGVARRLAHKSPVGHGIKRLTIYRGVCSGLGNSHYEDTVRTRSGGYHRSTHTRNSFSHPFVLLPTAPTAVRRKPRPLL